MLHTEVKPLAAMNINHHITLTTLHIYSTSCAYTYMSAVQLHTDLHYIVFVMIHKSKVLLDICL